MNRRAFLGRSGLGLIALTSLLNSAAARAAGSSVLASKGAVNPLHHAARAKRVIFLYMSGGPSHLETFDYKPELERLHGRPMPESFTKGQPIAQLQGQKLMVQGPMTKFRRHGKSGQLVSDFLPWHGKIADDICIIRSM